MEVTDSLRDDHRIIEMVLPVLEGIGREAEGGAIKRQDKARAVIRFLPIFVEEFHHGKEERQLFRVMENRGVSRREGFIAELLEEHRQGRKLVKEMRATIEGALIEDEECLTSFTEHALEYVELLQQHIEKEDERLWPLVEETLQEEDEERLLNGYEQIEKEALKPEGKQAYREVAKEIAETD